MWAWVEKKNTEKFTRPKNSLITYSLHEKMELHRKFLTLNTGMNWIMVRDLQKPVIKTFAGIVRQVLTNCSSGTVGLHPRCEIPCILWTKSVTIHYCTSAYVSPPASKSLPSVIANAIIKFQVLVGTCVTTMCRQTPRLQNVNDSNIKRGRWRRGEEREGKGRSLLALSDPQKYTLYYACTCTCVHT